MSKRKVETLAELDGNPAGPGDGTNITPGDGSDQITNLAEEQRRQQLADAEAARAAAAAKTDPPAGDPPAGDPPAGDPPAGDPPAGTEELEPGDDPTVFWNSVNTLRGIKDDELKIVYKDAEGADIDPISPEGVVLREEAIERRAIDRFSEQIRSATPRAYDFLLHIQSGKPESDFWGGQKEGLPAMDLFSTSVDLQKKVLREELEFQKVKPKHIEQIIENAVTAKTLTEDATAAYNERQAREEAARVETERQIVENQTKFKTESDSLTARLTTAVTENLKFIVPEGDRPEFFKLIGESLGYDGKQFLVNLPLNDTNLVDVLKGLYITHKKTDLKAVITTEAKKQNVVRLRQSVAKSGQQPGSAEGKSDKKFVSLGSMFRDPE